MQDDFVDAVEGLLPDEDDVVGVFLFGGVVDAGVGTSSGEDASPLLDFPQVILEAASLVDDGVEVFIA